MNLRTRTAPGAALCLAVALLVPASPVTPSRAAERAGDLARSLLAPHRYQVVAVTPPRAEPAEPQVAPDPVPTAYDRTVAILQRRARPGLETRAGELAGEIVRLSEAYAMEPELILAMIQTESSFRPEARSRKGAVGLMQLLPTTARPVARELGIEWRGARTLSDPVLNVRMGVHYLAGLRARFDGDLDLAVSAYNLGPSRVDRYLRQGKRPRWYAGKVACNRAALTS